MILIKELVEKLCNMLTVEYYEAYSSKISRFGNGIDYVIKWKVKTPRIGSVLVSSGIEGTASSSVHQGTIYDHYCFDPWNFVKTMVCYFLDWKESF